MEQKKLDKIVIVGGGTAGWLTALCFNKALPNSSITLIESDEIGILGAGEATTPNFVHNLDFLGIPLNDFITNTGATIKNSIKFTNWNGDGTHYYHDFSSFDPELNPTFSGVNLMDAILIHEDVSNDERTYNALLNVQKKTPFIENNYGGLLMTTRFALHFNARKVAEYLKTIGLERGIKRIEGKVTSINSDKDGYITGVEVDTAGIVPLDFVFDCSGFKRLIIGQHFNATFKRYENLPVKRAIPFFLPIDDLDSLNPYTECIAMKYGWAWKIPTQDRYGCGYVFDSDLISDEEAKKEIEKEFGIIVDSPKAFSFNAGYLETPWIKNCIALGLASSFIEPLESTSLMSTLIMVHQLIVDLSVLYSQTPEVINNFNMMQMRLANDAYEFIYAHYMTERSDSDFWLNFKDLNRAPKKVKDLYELWNSRLPLVDDIPDAFMFQYINWMAIFLGTKQLNKKSFDVYFDNNNFKIHIPDVELFKKTTKERAEKCLTHGEYLRKIGVKDETK